jgi:antitoxin HicB
VGTSTNECYNDHCRQRWERRPKLPRERLANLSSSDKGAKTMTMIDGYHVDITWSDEDNAYLITIPRLEKEQHVIMPCGHGDTYEEAVEEAKFLIPFILESDMLQVV